MSLRRNILASFTSQAYIFVVGIVPLPLFIKYMGPEAYGLVGFFAMLQAWFNLLDMGLTPTMARETARFRGGALDLLGYRRLARALEGVFFVVATLGGAALYFSANWIGESWLNASKLSVHEVTVVIQLMAVIVALRWVSGLYRGVIAGFERLVWLSVFNSVVVTMRFVLIFPVLIFISATPKAFFIFQLGVAVLEALGLIAMSYRLLPSVPDGQRIPWHYKPLKPVLGFSLSIALTSSIWALVTQADKLILSKILPLAEFGYFTAAVLVAGGILTVSTPVSSAILPRMARLNAEVQGDKLIELYRQATQLIVVITIPATLLLVFFSKQVLWVWTGDAELVDQVGSVLPAYALGYGFLVVSALPYYLQYAKGSLGLHVVGSILFALILIPSVIWATADYGMVGAGWAWLLANFCFFVVWPAVVHRRFVPGIHLSWLWLDIFRPASVAAIASGLCSLFMVWEKNRVYLAIELVAVGGGLFFLTYLLAGRVRAVGWRIQ